MKTLGIDYGRSKIGLAIGIGILSEPLKVVRVSSFEDAVNKIEKEIEIEKPDRVIVGISEGEMAIETKKFRKRLEEKISVSIKTFDETLTSRDAQKLSIEAGLSHKKRRQMEDAYAASLMLQGYLDTIKP